MNEESLRKEITGGCRSFEELLERKEMEKGCRICFEDAEKAFKKMKKAHKKKK
jgi:hypothetical protein